MEVDCVVYFIVNWWSFFCTLMLSLCCFEQSLQALKKISQEHPTACLRAGALMAVLSYLDFFSTGVQVIQFSVFLTLKQTMFCN